MVGNSPLVVSPQAHGVASSDGGAVAGRDCGKTGTGENLQRKLEGELLSSATVPGSDLQENCSSLPLTTESEPKLTLNETIRVARSGKVLLENRGKYVESKGKQEDQVYENQNRAQFK